MKRPIIALICAALTNLSVSLYAVAGTITTIAGGEVGDGGSATSAPISPVDVSADAAGNIYIADATNRRIRKVDTSGSITTVAGGGLSVFSDGDLATNVQIAQPKGVTIDGAGNIYISSSFQIHKVNTSGVITTMAGTGNSGFSGDTGLAISADLNNPEGMAVDSAGNLYIADAVNDRIRKVDTSGIITTVAGNGVAGFSGDSGLATSASLNDPQGVAVDAVGNIYIADKANHRIRKVDTSGIITTIAGNGMVGFSGDGGLATSARLNNPKRIVLDATGNLYIAESSGNRIRKVDTSDVITTIAGGLSGFSGDGGPATSAGLLLPGGVAIDTTGNIFIADSSNRRIRKVDTSGTINTVAGNGFASFYGDGNPATNSSLKSPTDVIRDGAGNLFIADRTNHVIRKIDTSGIITTVAGNGVSGFDGDSGFATSARLSQPTSIALDGTDNLYIAVTNSHRIRKVDSSGVITTIAGIGSSGYSGDTGLATSAELDRPEGVAVDTAGNIYISDTKNHAIRKINTSGIITTIAGNGSPGDSGDGGLAVNAELNTPVGLTTDTTGNLYIADSLNNRIRKIDTAGNITTVAGDGTFGFSGDGGAATSASLDFPFDRDDRWIR